MELVIYLLGVLLLGYFYEPLKTATGGGAMFVLSAFLYLGILRLVGYGVRRYIEARRSSQS